MKQKSLEADLWHGGRQSCSWSDSCWSCTGTLTLTLTLSPTLVLGAPRVDRAEVLTLVLRLDVTHLQVPLLDVTGLMEQSPGKTWYGKVYFHSLTFGRTTLNRESSTTRLSSYVSGIEWWSNQATCTDTFDPSRLYIPTVPAFAATYLAFPQFVIN